MKNLIRGMFLLVVFAASLGAQNPAPPNAKEIHDKSRDDAKCGIMYGKSHWFSFCASDGWTLDNEIGKQMGLFAILYPNGSSWESARVSGTFMYVNTSAKKDDNDTVARFMALDADNVKKNVQSAVVKKGEPIRIGSLNAQVLLYAPGGYNRYEAVAYVDSLKVFIMYVMSSVNEAAFKRDYPAFVRLVQTHIFFGTEVTIEDK
jgi:hypothetical protein